MPQIHKVQHDSQYSERSNDQCKEIEENNRMGRLEISSRKLETPREHFRQRWVQYRTEMDPTEAENIKKRWQEYTEKLYKKDLHDPDHSPKARYPGTRS